MHDVEIVLTGQHKGKFLIDGKEILINSLLLESSVGDANRVTISFIAKTVNYIDKNQDG